MKTLVVFVACFSAAFAQNYLEPPAAPAAADATIPAAVAAAVVTAAPAEPEIPLEPIVPMGPGCRAPGGGELTTMMTNVADVMLNTMMTDRETRGIIGFMASGQFQQTLTGIQNNIDFQTLSDFVCREMYMDLDYFITWLNGVVAAPPAPRRIAGVPRGGLNELLDLSDIPPSLMNLMVPAASFDPHFASVYMAYRAPAFDRMLSRVENSRSFKRLEDQLKMFNFDLQDAGDFCKEILYQYRRNRRYQV